MRNLFGVCESAVAVDPTAKRHTYTIQRVEVKMIREPVQDGFPRVMDKQILCGDDVALWFSNLVNADREKFVALHLDCKHHVICLDVVSVGSLTASVVHPREVFAVAIAVKAHSIILVHNHPSGDPSPSAEDIEITRRLQEVGRLVGIEICDHVIIGRGGHTSFAEKGLL
jgi:DNA repair protein RadC